MFQDCMRLCSRMLWAWAGAFYLYCTHFYILWFARFPLYCSLSLYIRPHTHTHTHTHERIVSFCHVRDLKSLEAVCKLTNNSKEVRDIVEAIRRGLDGTNSTDQLADIRDALTHLCNMTISLKHQVDVSARILFSCFGIHTDAQLFTISTLTLTLTLITTLSPKNSLEDLS